MSEMETELFNAKSALNKQTLLISKHLFADELCRDDPDFALNLSKIKLVTEQDCPSLPLISGKLHAGYPSPAENYIEERLKPTEYLIEDEAMSFLRIIEGESLNRVGIVPGTIVVIYYGVEAKVGDILFAEYNGYETIKILGRTPEGNPQLIPYSTKPFPTITITEFDDFRVVGVIDSWFMRRRKKRS